MPKLSYRVEVDVTLYIPEEYAARITKDDVHEMAASVLGHNQAGMGIQVIVDGVAQWSDMSPDRYEKSDPIFADAFVGGWMDDGEIEIEEDGFDHLDKELGHE